MKNCPCCGSDKIKLMSELENIKMAVDDLDIEESQIDRIDHVGWYVICDAREGGCGMISGWGETKNKAMEKWNKRVGENEAEKL